ncbi:MAG: hypothetical protein ACI4B5_09320 [Bacteroidaceae bacterium]
MIDNPYGVCTHITRRWSDYPIRDRELALANEVGIGWIRSDYDFGTVFAGVCDFHPQVFDDVSLSCQIYNQQFLAILTWLGKMPWDDPLYASYVDSLARRYDGKVTHWEMMNEVNLIGNIDSLPKCYASSLRVASECLHRVNPNNKVLLSGLAEVKDDFLEQLCRLDAMKWVDVMNFHSYFRPEELIQCFEKISTLMDRYGWSKPVWLTECGMHTCDEGCPASGFYLDFLPAALHRLKIPINKICVGYLADRTTGFVTLNNEQVQQYLVPVAGKVEAISLDQLASLSVARVPVLLATTDEYFPKDYFASLVDYVRRGGTIILSGGMPFYYDAYLPSNTWFNRHETGTSLLKQLHMSSSYEPRDSSGEDITEIPSVVRVVPGAGFSYSWNISDKSPARYLTEGALAKGDSLIPLITAGTQSRQIPVAGIYRLNSDLHGNIIFQTRMYAHPLPDKEAEQARRVARIYLLALAHGVERVFWYNFRARETDPFEPEDCFGLIHADFSEKPSLQAYRTLTSMLPSGSTRPHMLIDENVFSVSWIRPDGHRVTAMWSPYVPVRYKLKNRRTTCMYNYLGEKIPFKGRSITLTDAVTYLVE